MKKNILVVGTGTIGEPLIGLLADFKKKLGINVYFHKRTPLLDEIAKVNSLTQRGARLVATRNTREAFAALGHKVNVDFKVALCKADVVIDCTPAGNHNKEEFYSKLVEKYRLPASGRACEAPGCRGRFCKKKKITFIAQGSEKGFGIPYAYGINDRVLGDPALNTQFIQVVSCNTHNISSLIKTISPDTKDLHYGDFTCIRRANDISQKSKFIASPEVGAHSDVHFGTHHAKDAYDLFGTIHEIPNIFSSAMKVNTQYMHSIRFNLHLKKNVSKEEILTRLEASKFISVTHKNLANKVFSFGRDHGYYGRIFNHTVVSLPTLHVGRNNGHSIVTGFCFTPQDGNSLLSSAAAALWGCYGEEYKEHIKVFDKYLFQQI